MCAFSRAKKSGGLHPTPANSSQIAIPLESLTFGSFSFLSTIGSPSLPKGRRSKSSLRNQVDRTPGGDSRRCCF